MRRVLVLITLLPLSANAANWKQCQKWIKQAHHAATGQFQDIEISDSGKVRPSSTSREFNTENGKDFTMKTPSNTNYKKDPTIRVMSTTATEGSGEIRIVRKWKDNKLGMYKGKAIIADKIQKYQVVNLKILPNGQCTPTYKADFEYEVGKGMKGLVGRTDYFSPYCRELQSEYRKMTDARKKQIVREINSKDFLEDARDIIHSVYPESKLKGQSFSHNKIPSSTEDGIKAIMEKCEKHKIGQFGWSTWTGVNYKDTSISTNPEFSERTRSSHSNIMNSKNK